MSKRNFFLGLGAALTMFATACDTGQLTEANNNPNDPTNAPSGPLFTQAARLSAARWVDGVGGTRYGFLPQLLAQVQYPDDDQYLASRLGASATQGLFNNAYSGELQDLDLIVARGKSATPALPGLWGPAQVLSSWGFGILTDVFGDVPYTQAFDPDILQPAYDPQAEIYDSLFMALGEAAAALGGATNELGTADPIYGGDPASWRRLANSLRLRHALRLMNVDATTAGTQVAAARADAGGFIDENSENALLVWPGDGVYDSPWANNFKTRDDHRVSINLVSTMQSFNDPRIEVYAMPAAPPAAPDARTVTWCPAFAGGDCYVGLQNALTQATASPLLPNTSRPGEIFYPGVTSYGTFGGPGKSFPSYLFTAAETNFLLAEAAERSVGGLTPGQAAGFYNAGVTASLEQWGITGAAATAYLAQPGVTYTPGPAGLVQIATQKWLALYTDPIQAWSEVRRTCRPAIVEPGPDARFDLLPRRLQYSTTEAAVNRASKNEAATRQFGHTADTMLDRIYWDAEAGWTASPTYLAGCSER